MLSVSMKDLKLYLYQFTDVYNLENFFKIKVLNNYYETNESKDINHQKLIEILNNLEDSKYWMYHHNTQLNTSIAA